jgi:AraC-like DNA-binding protein
MPASPRDNMYVLGLEGFAYTTDRSATGFTQRHEAVVMVNAHHAPFELELEGGERISASAVVVAPMVKRRLLSPHGHLVDFHITPSHRLYRRFLGIPVPGAVAIDRRAFSEWDEALVAMHEGSTNLDCVQSLFEPLARRASELFVARAPMNPTQCEQVHQLIERHPAASLAEMAEELGVSPRWMAKLFQQAMGMPHRDFQTWLKHRRTLELIHSRRSLTEVAHAAGFTDSAQFTRSFQRWYGQNPSFTRDPQRVRLFMAPRSTQSANE